MSEQMAELSAEELARLRSVRPARPLSTMRTISALILREMAATYGRSPGGYLWAVLEPALGIGLLVAVFSVGFRAPPLGKNFALFYATGLLPLFVFTTTSVKVAQAINFSRQLMSYPRVTFLDAILARFLLNVMTQGLIAVLILGGILAYFDTRTTLHLARVLNAFAMSAGLGLGVGILLCTLISQHPIWNTIWSVITRPLFLISGVILLHENIPQPYGSWLDWNPLVHVTGQMRRGFYYSYRAEYLNQTFVWLVALTCALIGLFFLRRYYRDMMEK